jgi:orotidine-5'-phosphate decarboxylase
MEERKDAIIVALDIGERGRLLSVADKLRDEVKIVKVGLEAYTSIGPGIIDELNAMGFKVFVDLKLHDIPNTVAKAVGALVRRKSYMITVHASGGRMMLEWAVNAAREESEKMGAVRPLILGVTVLTSLDAGDLGEIAWPGDVREMTLSLGRLAIECGLDGLVASAREASILRGSLGSGPVIVTPGIRLEGEGKQDQARAVTPMEAISAGADYLVLGRTVISKPDPLSALRVVRRSAGL